MTLAAQAKPPKTYYGDVLGLLERHHQWFRECLPLIASENVPSAAVREALASDFANRYAEGWPGERVYAGCRYIDQVELIAIELAQRLFRAEFADVRPVSGVCANLAVYSAFTSPSDRLLALAIPNGGHISMGKKEFGGTAGLVHGLRVEYFAFDREAMTIDVDATKQRVEKMVREEHDPPRLAIFGGSLFLFPHPVRELADFLHGHSITVAYDSAHVSGLIAGGQFQDPLREGADVMTLSTHKTLYGPQGGVVLSLAQHADAIKKAVFPGTASNHHLHSVAGKAIAFAEFLQFGQEYAAQIVRNARALAEALAGAGLRVLGEKLGFTRSHQVAVDVTDFGDGGTLEQTLEQANIIVNRQLLPGDIQAGRHYMHPGGIRLGVQELTRLGLRESEMGRVADYLVRVIMRKESPGQVARDVADFRRSYQGLRYAFDSAQEAYAYFRLR